MNRFTGKWTYCQPAKACPEEFSGIAWGTREEIADQALLVLQEKIGLGTVILMARMGYTLVIVPTED